MRETGLPFDDIKNLVNSLPAREVDACNHTRAQLAEAGYAEGDGLRKLCEWYSSWSGRSPAVHRGIVTLFAGTHALDNSLSDGAAGEKVLARVTEISEGGALLNRLCHQHDLGLKVFDLALQLPVADISREAALDERGCAGTIAFGMEAIAGGADLLCIAALEPAVSLSNLAILAVLDGLDVQQLSKAFGACENNLAAAVNQAERHKKLPLEVLRHLGGRETSALCGAILAARSQHIPVVLDSIAGLAAASVLHALNKDAVLHCVFAQRPISPVSDIADQMGMACLFDQRVADDSLNALALGGGMVKSACLALQKGNQGAI